MLGQLRNWSTSWSAKILFGLMIVSMGAFFGLQQLFVPDSRYAVVATVGGGKDFHA